MSFGVTGIDSEFCGVVISLSVSVAEVVPTNDDINVVPGAIVAIDIVSNDVVVSGVSSGLNVVSVDKIVVVSVMSVVSISDEVTTDDELSDFRQVSDIRVASGDDVVIIDEVVDSEELWNEFDVLSNDSVSNSGIVLDDCEMDG